MKRTDFTGLYMAQFSAPEHNYAYSEVPQSNLMEALFLASISSGVISGMEVTANGSSRDVLVSSGLALLRDSALGQAKIFKNLDPAPVSIPPVLAGQPPKTVYIVAVLSELVTNTVDIDNAPIGHPDHDANFANLTNVPYVYSLESNFFVVDSPMLMANSVVVASVAISSSSVNVTQANITNSKKDATLLSKLNNLEDAIGLLNSRVTAIEQQVGVLSQDDGVGAVVKTSGALGYRHEHRQNALRSAGDFSDFSYEGVIPAHELSIPANIKGKYLVTVGGTLANGKLDNADERSGNLSISTRLKLLVDNVEPDGFVQPQLSSHVIQLVIAVIDTGSWGGESHREVIRQSVWKHSFCNTFVLDVVPSASNKKITLKHFFQPQWAEMAQGATAATNFGDWYETSLTNKHTTPLISEIEISQFEAIRIA